MASCILSIEAAQNIIVVKTVSGMAMAVGAAIDNLSVEGIMGCIAGDDTLFLAIKDGQQAEHIIGEIKNVVDNAHKNIALIEEIDIDFHEQLNILTGETGAGKSIIIGSLGICLGGKFPKELLRDDTKDGLVELVFSVDQPAIVEALEKLEVTPDEDGTLLISRRLSPNGRTVNRVMIRR